MFKLSPEEKAKAVANCDHLAKLKFSKVLPFAFTEHGAGGQCDGSILISAAPFRECGTRDA